MASGQLSEQRKHRSRQAKQWLRTTLGDDAAGWLHAARFRWLLATRPPAEPELAWLPRLLRQGEVAVDVGANGANWTWALAQQVGVHGQVFAFEADPYYAAVTDKTLRLLGAPNITFFPFGLSDTNTHADLLVATAGEGQLTGTGRVVSDGEAHGTTVQIVLRRLDDLLLHYPRLLQTRLFKCDVEGFELPVFRGAARLLSTARPIIVTELGNSDVHGYTAADLLAFLGEYGYQCFAVSADEQRLQPSDGPGAVDGKHRANRILLPHERIAQEPALLGQGG